MFGENKDVGRTLDHFLGHRLGAIIGKIDAILRLDYIAGALVGLPVEFTSFFGDSARLYFEIWPFGSEPCGGESTSQSVLRANEKNGQRL